MSRARGATKAREVLQHGCEKRKVSSITRRVLSDEQCKANNTHLGYDEHAIGISYDNAMRPLLNTALKCRENEARMLPDVQKFFNGQSGLRLDVRM